VSDATTLPRTTSAPAAESREKHGTRKRVVLFDQLLRDADLPQALQAAGFEVLPKRSLAESASPTQMPDLILAEIAELTAVDRQAVERLRAACPNILVIGVGSPVVVALSKGRRRA